MTGISGGVDSSVAAYLLKQDHYPVQGLFMKNWEEDDRDGHCSAEADLADAQAICKLLEIPLHTRNFSGEYWDQVFSHFLSEYQAGRTPNPDILCNREIKFKTFLDHAKALGADKIATGHYAQVKEKDGLYYLQRGFDQNKDQSYFLYTLGQTALSQTRFPVGHLPKAQVRKIAEQENMITHNKKDSTGICFIGERDFRSFLSQFIPAQKGEMLTPEGEYIGEHDGSMYYTLGQRQGLGIGGRATGNQAPWFVVGKNTEKNQLIVAQGHNHPLLFSNQLRASDLTWVSGFAPAESFQCTAKTRYRQTDQTCSVTLKNQQAWVQFDQAQRAVTPGQSVVFYHQSICLGGGIIEEAWNE